MAKTRIMGTKVTMAWVVMVSTSKATNIIAFPIRPRDSNWPARGGRQVGEGTGVEGTNMEGTGTGEIGKDRYEGLGQNRCGGDRYGRDR